MIITLLHHILHTMMNECLLLCFSFLLLTGLLFPTFMPPLRIQPFCQYVMSENVTCKNKSYCRLVNWYFLVSIFQLHFLFSTASYPTMAGNLSQWWSRSPSWPVSFSLSGYTLAPRAHMWYWNEKIYDGTRKKTQQKKTDLGRFTDLLYYWRTDGDT